VIRVDTGTSTIHAVSVIVYSGISNRRRSRPSVITLLEDIQSLDCAILFSRLARAGMAAAPPVARTLNSLEVI
jgi:hypothetical protein